MPTDTDSWAFTAAGVESISAAADPSSVKRPYPGPSTGLQFIQVCCHRCVPATETCRQPLGIACCLLLAALGAKVTLLALPSYFFGSCTLQHERLAIAEAAWVEQDSKLDVHIFERSLSTPDLQLCSCTMIF